MASSESPSPASRLLQGQRHIELRPLPRPRINPHAATVQLYDFLAQRQAQPGAAFLAPDLHKRLEDPPLLAVGNAFTVVLDADNHPFAMATRLQADLPTFGSVP